MDEDICILLWNLSMIANRLGSELSVCRVILQCVAALLNSYESDWRRYLGYKFYGAVCSSRTLTYV